jgi:acetyl esterase/lipase
MQTKILPAKFTICLTICAAALLLSNRFCLAQDPCPNNGEVHPTSEETLAGQYQPGYPNDPPPVLERFRFLPPGAGQSQTFPTVLTLPPDIFKLEYQDYGNSFQRQASYDLQQAGFLVFQVDHRLAPPGHLASQLGTDNGYAPEQTDDLKRQILAALADPQCNGNIYLVGGSAGGCLVLWCALDPASTVTGWNEAARSHIKAVVSLSGPTQFCDWTDPGTIPHQKLLDFENDLDNYVNLPPQTRCDPNCDWSVTCALDQASPAWLVTHGATSNPPPIRLYTTLGDTVPYLQADDMYNALITRFPSLDVQKYIMSYPYTDPHNHSYKYWHAINDAPGSDGLCVSQEVISFLQTH